MGYFVKGQGLLKVPYKSDFEERSAVVDFVAGNYTVAPQDSGVDVLTSVQINDKSIGKGMITDPTSITEVSLPATYLAIGANAFVALTNLEKVYIYAGQEITIGSTPFFDASAVTVYVDYAFLSDYQTDYPTLNFAGFASGYTWEVPYVEGVTSTTLTVNYVESVIGNMTAGAKNAVGQVIVPVYFIAYESGAIQAMLDAFTNLEHLVTTYESGTIDLNMNGDVVAKILSLNKTLDEALVYARSTSLRTGVVNFTNDESLIIAPPMQLSDDWTHGKNVFRGCSNLVLIQGVIVPNINEYFFLSSPSIIEINNLTVLNSASYYRAFDWADNIKRIHIVFQNDSSLSSFSYSGQDLEELTLVGQNRSVTISSTQFTRQALVDLINSLGTPSTTKTLTIGATNLAKLTNADIQLSYDKNFALSPVPAAFALSLGSDTYSCAFGSTWATWVASAYNTAGYQILNNKVYDSTGTQVVQKDGTDVADTDMVRYGDTYTLA